MKRNIIYKLIQWKANARRKPLLVRGARQVGKTYTIMEFGQIHFNGNIHAFNFEKNPEIHSNHNDIAHPPYSPYHYQYQMNPDHQ